MRTYQLETAGVTDIGQTRAVNEDHLIHEGDLFAVAGGMGGLGHGDVAARLALDTLWTAFGSDPTASGLIAAIGRANRAVHDHPGSDSSQMMGSTVAAVAYVVEDAGDVLVVANVGDSRVYLLRNGHLRCLTTDHSKVADLVRAGTVSLEEAAVHPERHVLTRALGVGPDVDPAVARITPSPGDRLLLCSDGLHNEIPDHELARLLNGSDDPGSVARWLIAVANERGGDDNITALVVDVA